MTDEKGARAGQRPELSEHANSFGFLRLLFASLVIVSHTPEIVDGNRAREILTIGFRTISFGEFAVAGFFLISGYLITASFMMSRTSASYLTKRVARIYPAFICAYLICILVVAPIGGAKLPQDAGEYLFIAVRALLLLPPDVGTVFQGTPYPYLNSSMWTISVEFKCYILALLVGTLGIFRKKSVVLTLTTLLLLTNIIAGLDYHSYEQSQIWRSPPTIFSLSDWNSALLGNKKEVLKLSSIFMTGSCFYLYRRYLSFRFHYIALALVCLVLALSFERLAIIGVCLFSGYLIFSVAELNKGNRLARVNNKDDVSYGLYLYAFPVTKLIVHFGPHMSIALVGILTFFISYGLGWVSWSVVEKPIMRRIRRSPQIVSGSGPNDVAGAIARPFNAGSE
jgi:peptidoglycan/LPS O-acetylase OafA/YrhL